MQNRRTLIAAALLVLSVIAFGWIIYSFGKNRQPTGEIAITPAVELVDQVTAKTQGEAQYQFVSAAIDRDYETGEESVVISGFVPSQQSLKSLQGFIESLPVSAPLEWQVRIGAP